MSGSSSIRLKNIRVRMSGTVGNRNYGNLNPEVSLDFDISGVENWDEAVQQCISVAHDAFIHAAVDMLSGYHGARDVEDMLQELGVRVVTSVIPLGVDDEYDFVFDEDDEDADFDVFTPEENRRATQGDDEDEDTQQVDVRKIINDSGF